MINLLTRILGGGGHKPFKLQRKEDLRQEYNYSSSNSDFNKNGGELYLNQDAITFASENIVGGGSYARLTKSTQAVALMKENVLMHISKEVKAIMLA